MRLTGVTTCLLLLNATSSVIGAAKEDHLQVAALVNGTPIHVREVERERTRVLGDRQVDRETLDLLDARALRQLIDRELVLQWLAERKIEASEAEIELSISRLAKRLESRGATLVDYLSEREMTREDLARAARWQIAWPKFLDRYTTEDNLRKYFEDHRADFDGTQLRVAHLLLAVRTDQPEQRAALFLEQKEFAAKLRQQIAAGEITFAEAARRHSAAPTASQGGDIGLISRHDPMPEEFSRAAYTLAVGEVSEPVSSPFGVHLIQCLAIEPGQTSWTAVRDELLIAVKQYLFDWARGMARKRAQLEFTGATPHFRPGTEELVVPPQ